MQMWNFDILASFEGPSRVEKIMQIPEIVPEVVEVDIWINLSARRLRPDGSEGSAVYMFAPRAGSNFFPGPSVLQGRWLLPEDENALVIDALILKDEPDLRVGGPIVLKIEGREHTFRIVGVSMGIMAPMVYGNYPYIARITGRTGESDAALIRAHHHDSETQSETIAALEAGFKHLGLRVGQVAGTAKEREEADALFGVLISLLIIMSMLLALVGGLGLMGTMSINVLERTREIGVLRAIGASNRGVGWVFIREGVAIGVLSWIFSALFAFPFAKLLSDAVGVTVLGAPLSFSYSFSGAWIWLILVSALSALASMLPARNASRLTVREVLAYE
jgi:putative ABC transport system permease protein